MDMDAMACDSVRVPITFRGGALNGIDFTAELFLNGGGPVETIEFQEGVDVEGVKVHQTVMYRISNKASEDGRIVYNLLVPL